MRTYRFASFTLAIVAIGLTVGCQVTTGVSTVVRSTGGPTPVGYEIEEQSPQLAKLVKIRQATAQRVNGLWQAQVEVRNIAQHSLMIEYRFLWRDAQGIEQPSLLGAWRDATLASGETVALQGIASSVSAANYVFSVRLRE